MRNMGISTGKKGLQARTYMIKMKEINKL